MPVASLVLNSGNTVPDLEDKRTWNGILFKNAVVVEKKNNTYLFFECRFISRKLVVRFNVLLFFCITEPELCLLRVSHKFPSPIVKANGTFPNKYVFRFLFHILKTAKSPIHNVIPLLRDWVQFRKKNDAQFFYYSQIFDIPILSFPTWKLPYTPNKLPPLI